MLSNLYYNPGARILILEEIIKHAHKELRSKHAEEKMQNYFSYVFITALGLSRLGDSIKESIIEEKKDKYKVAFPTDSFKQIKDFVDDHICLRTLIDIILELLKAQKICTHFGESSATYFNDELISDIYTILMSIFKFVLKKV